MNKNNLIEIKKCEMGNGFKSKKKIFTLTENDIKHMVYESVKKLMKEDIDGNKLFGNLFGGDKLGDMFRRERNAQGYFIFFSDSYQNGMNINDIKNKIEPVCTLTEEDINEEQGEVLINGKPKFVTSENTNYWADNTSNFCQAGDLVFECNNEYAFYRPGLNTPSGFVYNDALVGTKDEIMDYINKYLRN